MKKYLLTALIFGSLTPLAHACTLPKSYYKNVSCTARSGVFLAVRDNGSPVALLNKKGEKMADLFAYEAVLGSEFRSGLLPALKNGKVGYINEKGKTVIHFQYDRMGGHQWARGVRDDRVIVKQNQGFGVLDTRGRVIIKPTRDISDMSDFLNSKAYMVKNHARHQIDKNGNILTQTRPQTHTAPTSHRTIHQPVYHEPKPVPLPPLSNKPFVLTPKQKNGKWGFVSDLGIPMILYTFDEVRPYSEELAGVRMGDYWGFIDKGGNLVINFRFHKDGFIFNTTNNPELPEPLIFKNGKAWIGSLNNGDKLCINPKGTNIDC